MCSEAVFSGFNVDWGVERDTGDNSGVDKKGSEGNQGDGGAIIVRPLQGSESLRTIMLRLHERQERFLAAPALKRRAWLRATANEPG